MRQNIIRCISDCIISLLIAFFIAIPTLWLFITHVRVLIGIGKEIGLSISVPLLRIVSVEVYMWAFLVSFFVTFILSWKTFGNHPISIWRRGAGSLFIIQSLTLIGTVITTILFLCSVAVILFMSIINGEGWFTIQLFVSFLISYGVFHIAFTSTVVLLCMAIISLAVYLYLTMKEKELGITRDYHTKELNEEQKNAKEIIFEKGLKEGNKHWVQGRFHALKKHLSGLPHYIYEHKSRAILEVVAIIAIQGIIGITIAALIMLQYIAAFLAPFIFIAIVYCSLIPMITYGFARHRGYSVLMTLAFLQFLLPAILSMSAVLKAPPIFILQATLLIPAVIILDGIRLPQEQVSLSAFLIHIITKNPLRLLITPWLTKAGLVTILLILMSIGG